MSLFCVSTYLRMDVLNFKTKVLYFAYNEKKEIVPGPGWSSMQ